MSDAPPSVHLDWSGRNGAAYAHVLPEPEPCEHCGGPALLRNPRSRRPCHKVCEEKALTARATELAARPAGRRRKTGVHQPDLADSP